MNRDEILTALSIRNEEQIEAMRRRLRAMENDGQLVFTKRKRYALPEKLDLFKGTVIGHREGFGFLQVDGKRMIYSFQTIKCKESCMEILS